MAPRRKIIALLAALAVLAAAPVALAQSTPTGGGLAAGGETDEGEEFVSPNVQNLDLRGALEALSSPRQKELLEASEAIDAALDIHGRTTSAVGAWSDGAENSVMIVAHGASWEQLRAAAAMEGALANQKAALVVLEDPKGSGFLYRFQARGDLAAIHQSLLSDGLEFHTLVPNRDGATVFIVDPNGSRDTMTAVEKAAARHDAEVISHRVRAEFIGTQKSDGSDADQRADAQESYARIIAGSGLQGSQALWARIHDQFAPAFGAR